MKAISSKKIFTGEYFIHDAVIVYDNNIIIDIGDKSILSSYPNIKTTHVNGIIVPGFIDIQVNGAGGADFYGDDIAEDTLIVMSKTLQKYGCTSFCPTLITSSDDDIHKALDLVNNSKILEEIGVLGLHIEGPMFSMEHKGAHNPDLLRVLSPNFIEKICNSKVKIVSLSPEVAPMEYISQLSKAGIKVSIAHTNATLKEVRHAETHGASLGTHLYNGMSRFSSREPNVVGALLTSKSMYSSVIPDGHHSDFESVILAHKCLGDRFITITDGIVAMGTDMKRFKLGFQSVHIDDQNRCIGDYGGLAGSMITPIECIQNLVNHCEFSLEEALRSYSSTPAKALGIQNHVGFLHPNHKANFIVLDESSLTIDQVYYHGNICNG